MCPSNERLSFRAHYNMYKFYIIYINIIIIKQRPLSVCRPATAINDTITDARTRELCVRLLVEENWKL